MKYKIIILGGLTLILLVGIVAFLFGRKGGGDGISGEIQVWGFETKVAWQEVIDAFKEQYGVKVVYQQKNKASYESELLNALAAGHGPDVFFIHHTWLNKHLDKLMPFSADEVTASAFRNSFVGVAASDLIRNDTVYALPLYVDTLALYYNKDLFNTAGVINPAVTWEEFSQAVEKIVRRDETGAVLKAGAALGTANNVNYAANIVEVLMLQTGAQMIDSTGRIAFNKAVTQAGKRFKPGEDALVFYTSFADPAKSVYTWHRRLANSLSAFQQGETAMYFGYASDLESIKSSGINFGIAPLPQIKDHRQDPDYIDLNYARYWAGAINKLSYNRSAAQVFLKFVTSRNAAFSFLSKAQLPTARRDLIEIQLKDPNLAVFARQTLTAAGWAQPDFTRIETIFNDMIEDVVLGRLSATEALETAADKAGEL